MTFSDSAYQAFVAFEKSAWVEMSAHYDSIAGQMTRQAVNPILDAVGSRDGSTLLDVATGPGYVAAAAAGRGARPVGIDFSQEMIAGARQMFPNLELEQGDAEDLRYRDASFDAAACAFGMLHFARPGKALAEMRRVVRPGGKVVYTIWSAPAKDHLFGTIREVVLKHADLGAAAVPSGPGAFMLSDPLVSMALMDAAGLTEIRVEEVPCHFDVRTPRDILGFLNHCSPRVLPIFRAQTEEIRGHIEQALINEGKKAIAVGGSRIPCPILLASGLVPQSGGNRPAAVAGSSS